MEHVYVVIDGPGEICVFEKLEDIIASVKMMYPQYNISEAAEEDHIIIEVSDQADLLQDRVRVVKCPVSKTPIKM